MKKYQQIGFYFSNDYPRPKTSPSYPAMYDEYQDEKPTYLGKSNGEQLGRFFNTVVEPNYKVAQEMAIDIAEQIKNSTSGIVKIVVDSSCSAPQTVTYNKSLSARRIESVIKFFAENPATKKYVQEQKLLVVSGSGFGEEAKSTPLVAKNTTSPYEFSPGTTVNCSDANGAVVGGDTQAGSRDIYTTSAMACRRAYISRIDVNLQEPKIEKTPTTTLRILRLK